MAAQSLDVDCIKIHVWLCWEQGAIVREGQVVGGNWDGFVDKSQTSHTAGKMAAHQHTHFVDRITESCSKNEIFSITCNVMGGCKIK